MYITKEFVEESDFGDLLNQYNVAMIKKMGLMASNASYQLLQQLKNPHSYVIGLLSSTEIPIGFTFLHTEGMGQSEGNIDLIFVTADFESPRSLKFLISATLNFMDKLSVKIVRVLSPTLGALDIETNLEELGFESITRFKFTSKPSQFQIMQSKLPRGFKIDSWKPEYALEVAKLITDGYRGTLEEIVFPQFSQINQVMLHINKLQNYPNQGIIKEASLVCLQRDKIIGTLIVLRIDKQNAFIWQIHFDNEHRGSPIARTLFELASKILYQFDYKQVSFTTAFEKLADYILKQYNEKVTLIERTKLYFYKVIDD